MNKNLITLICLLLLGTIILSGCNKSDNNQDYSHYQFYTLEESYEKGIISDEYLLSIFQYHNNNSLIVEKLNTTIEKSIIETRISELKARYPKVNKEEIYIEKYYGKYGDGYAVIIRDSYTSYGESIWSETINDLIFYYSGPRILFWHH